MLIAATGQLRAAPRRAPPAGELMLVEVGQRVGEAAQRRLRHP
jgi:hypothetical protein